MVADVRLTDPLLEFAVGGVLVLCVSRNESSKVHATIPTESGAGLFPYENNLSFFFLIVLFSFVSGNYSTTYDYPREYR